MAILEILDDGTEAGEAVRIRGSSYTIGRANGDLIIPHDDQMSGTHVRIERVFYDRKYQWILKDLDSTNGTFVRVAKATLENGELVMLGSYRYQFRASAVAAPQPDDSSGATRGWNTVQQSQGALTPTLVRLNSDGTEMPFALGESTLLIGQSDDCQIRVKDDPALSSQHAKISRSDNGQFVVQDLGSLNGTWIAIGERRIDRAAQFQIGEQRFRLRVPS